MLIIGHILIEYFSTRHDGRDQGWVWFEEDLPNADYLVNPSMIKKSIETEEEYNIVTNDKPSESSTEDLLKQLYWLGTVTPRIEKVLSLFCPKLDSLY